MSILKDKFITNRTEKENINKKIKETHVQPTEQEQNTAQDIIRKVSEQYAEELISKDISDISNQIAATVREYCNQLDLTYEEQKRIEKTVYEKVSANVKILGDSHYKNKKYCSCFSKK